MLRMLGRHAVQELLQAGPTRRAVAQQFHVSRRTIERIAREPSAAMGSDAGGGDRHVAVQHRPSADTAVLHTSRPDRDWPRVTPSIDVLAHQLPARGRQASSPAQPPEHLPAARTDVISHHTGVRRASRR